MLNDTENVNPDLGYTTQQLKYQTTFLQQLKMLY